MEKTFQNYRKGVQHCHHHCEYDKQVWLSEKRYGQKENIRLTKNHQTHLGERERDEVENLDFRAAKT